MREKGSKTAVRVLNLGLGTWLGIGVWTLGRPSRIYVQSYIPASVDGKLKISCFGRKALSVRRLAVEALSGAPLPWTLPPALPQTLR